MSHPSNQGAFGTDCGSCYWVEVTNEDPSHPSMAAAGVPKVPRSRTSSTTSTASRACTTTFCNAQRGHLQDRDGRAAPPGTEGGDHPISYCSNYDGGREWSQVLGHNWELYKIPWFRESIYQGILTAGALKYANCVTHTEVKTLLSTLQASGGITAAAATAGHRARSRAAFDKYFTLDKAQISSSLPDIAAFRTLA